MKTKNLTLTAVHAALAIAVSTLENIVPLTAFIPIPGLRLGIANIAMMNAYYTIGRKNALWVGIIKIFAVFLAFGNITSAIISLFGTLAAFASLIISERLNFKIISFIGVSAFSAVCHAMGQIAAVCLLTKSFASLVILLPLGLCSILTGALTGFLTNCIYPVIKNKITV